jgi:uncharacterized membrane protein YidH (DUF202 family)
MASDRQLDLTPKLVVTKPEGLRGREFTLPGEPTTVGRQVGCDIRLENPSVSRTHAKFVRHSDGRTFVCDLHSSNGTTVNGTAVETNGQALRTGDLICFGEVEVSFEGWCPDTTVVSPVPAGPVAPSGAKISIPSLTAGESVIIGRDQYISYVQQQRASFAREVAGAKTKARHVMWLGFGMFLIGGGTYVWAVLRFVKQTSAMTDQLDQTSDPSVSSLFGPSVGGVPVGLIGFAVANLGLILLMVGLVLHVVAASRRKRLEATILPPWQFVPPH